MLSPLYRKIKKIQAMKKRKDTEDVLHKYKENIYVRFKNVKNLMEQKGHCYST